jgi:hypothetical protein
MMKKAVIIALGLAALAAISGPVMAGDDWEYWSQYEATWKVGDRLQLRLKPELRFREDLSKHYYSHVEIGVDWRIRDWLVLAPCYRHVLEESRGDWKTEKRPEADATLTRKIGRVTVGDRNRLEYRLRDDNETFRYRNRLWVKAPKLSPAGVQPFLGEEVFYDFDADEINKNRVYAGLSVGFLGGLGADIY